MQPYSNESVRMDSLSLWQHLKRKRLRSISLNNMARTVCPTRYRTRNFFNNEDIATKIEADLTHCDDIITCAGSGHHFRAEKLIRINKELPGSVVSGTHCIIITDLYRIKMSTTISSVIYKFVARKGPDFQHNLYITGCKGRSSRIQLNIECSIYIYNSR